ASSVKIKSVDHYEELGYDENTIQGVTFAAKNPGSWANGIKVAIIDSKADQILSGVSTSGIGTIAVGYGVTQSLAGKVDSISGQTISLDDYYLKGIITEVNDDKISVQILSRVSSAGTETNVEYQQDGTYCFPETGSFTLMRSGDGVSLGTTTYSGEVDWFSQQSIQLTNTNISWNNIAPKPRTSSFSAERGSRFDEIHVVVFDDLGTITGNAGTILESHLNLSKASDALFSAGSTSYWRKYIASGSENIFAGSAPVGITTVGFDAGQFDLTTDNGWDQPAENVIFGAAGSNTYTLGGGLNYDGASVITSEGALTSTLAELRDGYDLFSNTESVEIDFLLMGSAGYSKETAQSLANKLISVAELRKDAIAFISSYRGAALTDTSVDTDVTVNESETITNNVLSFYSPIASSSFAVFDSGYKYMYDRFSDTFRYVPLNGDIAGLCARTDINIFPWYSPAGTARGSILNAVKLAYTPSRSQRDRLYTNRINPVIFSPGAGIILFGDKTGLGRKSAFDRINVRRLFLYIEDAISRTAKDFLFEFNDELTRTNFVNTIEPFLRDVQGKRGIFDFIVICDESNNTPAVIDANEFRADIYIKPARSINFIGLTFIATKTGVDFEEVIGNF
ncbi:MAG: phage tail sheath C-terminal domain-containing protein, partial [Minisyncoccia bacterium]